MILVDTNIVVDVLRRDPVWERWSTNVIEAHIGSGELAINPVIYAELSSNYKTVSDLESALHIFDFTRLDLPYEAAFLAGHAFFQYRKKGGAKHSPLPDFFIGAHAQSAKLRIITRDTARYRTYFSKVTLISPE